MIKQSLAGANPALTRSRDEPAGSGIILAQPLQQRGHGAGAERCEAPAIFQLATDTDPALADDRRLVAAAGDALGLMPIRTRRATSHSSRAPDGDGGETDHLPGDALPRAMILEGRRALMSRSRDFAEA